jgi:thiosulfate dehydrogenase [quinone] large subunit
MKTTSNSITQIPEPLLSRFLFADTRLAWLWLILRLYIGWQWIQAGYEKIISPVWVGAKAGVALQGFLMGALKKSTGQHPDVSGWYAGFINGFVLHHTILFSYMVSFGELFVGIALILGIFTGIAAFFGGFMNMNYLFAGTISISPLMFLLELLLILAWRVAGWYGIDRYLLPLLGTPWQPGKIFKRK